MATTMTRPEKRPLTILSRVPRCRALWISYCGPIQCFHGRKGNILGSPPRIQSPQMKDSRIPVTKNVSCHPGRDEPASWGPGVDPNERTEPRLVPSRSFLTASHQIVPRHSHSLERNGNKTNKKTVPGEDVDVFC